MNIFTRALFLAAPALLSSACGASLASHQVVDLSGAVHGVPTGIALHGGSGDGNFHVVDDDGIAVVDETGALVTRHDHGISPQRYGDIAVMDEAHYILIGDTEGFVYDA
ncbi:MAG TPA: hypothetical protein VGO62_07980, partial [Myxococcota bacterium]